LRELREKQLGIGFPDYLTRSHDISVERGAAPQVSSARSQPQTGGVLIRWDCPLTCSSSPGGLGRKERFSGWFNKVLKTNFININNIFL